MKPEIRTNFFSLPFSFSFQNLFLFLAFYGQLKKKHKNPPLLLFFRGIRPVLDPLSYIYISFHMPFLWFCFLGITGRTFVTSSTVHNILLRLDINLYWYFCVPTSKFWPSSWSVSKCPVTMRSTPKLGKVYYIEKQRNWRIANVIHRACLSSVWSGVPRNYT